MIPFSALLSQALVAFTIEFDNEFEARMPHRTTRHGVSPGAPEETPWLMSMVMWVNCLRFVPADGIYSKDLARAAYLTSKTAPMVLKRMSGWWGYLELDARDSDRGRLVRPTPAGLRAQEVWRPLADEVQSRWSERYPELAELVERMHWLATMFGQGLPDYLPLGERRPSRVIGDVPRDLPLYALLARVLQRFGQQAEARCGLALPWAANVLRVVDSAGLPVRELSALTGLDPMGIDNSLSTLESSGLIAVRSDGRMRTVRRTPSGERAQQAYLSAAEAVEREWRDRVGLEAVDRVRDLLEAMQPRLLAEIPAFPEGWRAQVTPKVGLPHYPMITHRGGFPDGS